jgi:L-ascorbate metabolism protein UlaG (beta-lactamase superfamily)
MKITHYSNSFITVEANGAKLVCDPWAGTANHGGWHSYPEYSQQELATAFEGANAIYISHLHSDHFNPDTLKRFGALDCHFLINDFLMKTLRQRLVNLGARRITELRPFSLADWEGFRVAIVPQMTSNSSGLEDDVNYALDSSIVIARDGVTFFNQVDNPLSMNNFGTIAGWIRDNVGPIDVLTLVCGAASEYPQCFMNIDRAAAVDSLIHSQLKQLVEKVGIFDPKFFFPSGGTYFIPGRFSILNRFIAVPGFERIEEAIGKQFPKLQVELLEGARQVEVTLAAQGPEFRVGRLFDRRRPTMNDAIQQHGDDIYDHEKDPATGRSFSGEEIEQAFRSAATEHERRLGELGIDMNARISFAVHDRIELDGAGRLATQPVMGLELVAQPLHPDHVLKVNIEKGALMRCLMRRASWNQTLSGSLCMFEREPNVFYPTDVFSLNYLVTPAR